MFMGPIWKQERADFGASGSFPAGIRVECFGVGLYLVDSSVFFMLLFVKDKFLDTSVHIADLREFGDAVAVSEMGEI